MRRDDGRIDIKHKGTESRSCCSQSCYFLPFADTLPLHSAHVPCPTHHQIFTPFFPPHLLRSLAVRMNAAISTSTKPLSGFTSTRAIWSCEPSNRPLHLMTALANRSARLHPPPPLPPPTASSTSSSKKATCSSYPATYPTAPSATPTPSGS